MSVEKKWKIWNFKGSIDEIDEWQYVLCEIVKMKEMLHAIGHSTSTSRNGMNDGTYRITDTVPATSSF